MPGFSSSAIPKNGRVVRDVVASGASAAAANVASGASVSLMSKGSSTGSLQASAQEEPK
jgi:hypothetical protein